MLIAEVAFPLPIFRTFHYSVPESMRAGIGRGSRVRAPFGFRNELKSGVVVAVSEQTAQSPYKLKEIEGLLDPSPILTDELLDLALWLSERYLAPLGEAISAVFPQHLKTVSRPRHRKTPPDAFPAPVEPVTLTPSQAQAFAALDAKLSAKVFEPVLLFGLPASGKTEVYIRLAEKALEQGGQVLFLVPEISLTHPFVANFADRLRMPIVTWHSRMGLAEKREAWLQLSRGERSVVIGARSASLLPFKKLRLAVLDEEQDESYKQDEPAPRYHAREVLLERARRHDALLVLGSATPSLESFHAAQEGHWAMLELTDRVFEQKELPRVEIVDRRVLKREFLNPRLVELIQDRLGRKEQVILLVNRRGFSSFIACRKCGWVARCKSCGLALVHHRMEPGKNLRCHHCSHHISFPDICPQCKHPGPLTQGGAGTQKVTQALNYLFPEARVLRMDRDVVHKGGRVDESLYRQFRDLEADILVGTKLVSKGFHFPEVTLVGVVDADTPLNLPDFRAAEKTFQLLFQAAGRAGRAEKEGLVVIQTSQPDHYVMHSLLARDYREFALKELEFRKDLHYPPFSHLARVLFTGSKEEAVETAAEKAAEALASQPECEGLELLGPSPGVYPRLRGKYRYQLLVKSPRWQEFKKVFESLKRMEIPPSIRWSVHIEPIDIF